MTQSQNDRSSSKPHDPAPRHRKLRISIEPDKARKTVAAGRDHLSRTKERVEATPVGGLWSRLRALDFMNEAFILAALLLLAFFPFLIVVSALANRSVARGLASRIGLNHQASEIVGHLFNSAATTSNALTAGSIVTLVFGAFAISGTLQALYEKIFSLDNRGMRDIHRLLVWVAITCLGSWGAGALARPIRNSDAGPVLLGIVSFVSVTLFFWWTMHFLLGARVSWRDLLPCALATAFCWIGLGVFSSFYFSNAVISNNRTYGEIGTIFTLMSWLIAVGVVVILGGVAGVMWNEWREKRRASQ